MLLPSNCILIVSMGVLHTVFLSRETHRINIELSRVAKTYAFGSKLYFGSFLWRFHIQFFCLEKPIGLTLSCLEWLNPMLLPQNCMNLSFNYYFKSTTLNSLILTIIYPSNRLILLCQELMVQLYIRILSPCSSVAINLRPYRSEVHH